MIMQTDFTHRNLVRPPVQRFMQQHFAAEALVTARHYQPGGGLSCTDEVATCSLHRGMQTTRRYFSGAE